MSTFLTIAIFLFVYVWCAFGAYGLGGPLLLCFVLFLGIIGMLAGYFFYDVREYNEKMREIRRQKADELVYRLKEKGLTLSDLFRKIEEDNWKEVQKRIESRRK